MKTWTKALSGATLAVAALAVTAPAHAQSATEWATRLVNMQKDAIVPQLASVATEQVLMKWAPQVAQLPQANQKAASDQLDVELRKLNDDNMKTLKTNNDRLATQVLVPEYTKNYSADELRQIVTFLESDAAKKYFSNVDNMANLLADRVVTASKTTVESRMNQFDKAAQRILKNNGGK